MAQTRTQAIVTLAIRTAHDAIAYADPGAHPEIGMGGWQTFKEEFPGNTEEETQLFTATFVATCETFGEG